MVPEDDKAVKNAEELLIKIGLDERTATNTVANRKLTSNLLSLIHQVPLYVHVNPNPINFNQPRCNIVIGNFYSSVKYLI